MASSWCFSLLQGAAIGIGRSSLFSLMLILDEPARQVVWCGRCFDRDESSSRCLSIPVLSARGARWFVGRRGVQREGGRDERDERT